MTIRLGCVANSALGYDGSRFLYEGGEWRYVERLAPLFDKVDICAPVIRMNRLPAASRMRFRRPLEADNAEVHALLDPRDPPASALQWARQRLDNHRHLKDISSDWDFGFLFFPGWLSSVAWLVRRDNSWPYAVSVRGDWHAAIAHRRTFSRTWLPLYRAVVRQVERRIVRDATIRIGSGKLLARRYPELAETFLPSANLELFLQDCRHRREAAVRRPARVVCSGRLIPRKAVDITLRAVCRLAGEGLEVRLSVIGDGPERASLEELAGELGIRERIDFVGHVYERQDLLDLYFEGDVFVISSHSEGFPRVIYEAMSQSLPVVATAVGGIPEMLDHGRTALLVAPDDPAALADAIEKVICDTRLRQRLTAGGFAFVREFLRRDPVAEAVRAVERAISLRAEDSGSAAPRDGVNRWR